MKIYKNSYKYFVGKKHLSQRSLKRIHEAFHVEIYFKLKPIECKITLLTLYILKLDNLVVKSAKISTILCLFVQNIKNIDRIAMVTVTQAK